jgi:hypothetical protein
VLVNPPFLLGTFGRRGLLANAVSHLISSAFCLIPAQSSRDFFSSLSIPVRSPAPFPPRALLWPPPLFPFSPMNHPAHRQVSRYWLAMVNTGRRSSIGSRFPLSSVPVPPSRGGAPSQPQEFTIPQFMSQGSQESL